MFSYFVFELLSIPWQSPPPIAIFHASTTQRGSTVLSPRGVEGGGRGGNFVLQAPPGFLSRLHPILSQSSITFLLSPARRHSHHLWSMTRCFVLGLAPSPFEHYMRRRIDYLLPQICGTFITFPETLWFFPPFLSCNREFQGILQSGTFPSWRPPVLAVGRCAEASISRFLFVVFFSPFFGVRIVCARLIPPPPPGSAGFFFFPPGHELPGGFSPFFVLSLPFHFCPSPFFCINLQRRAPRASLPHLA